jgi:hypothetical protein
MPGSGHQIWIPIQILLKTGIRTRICVVGVGGTGTRTYPNASIINWYHRCQYSIGTDTFKPQCPFAFLSDTVFIPNILLKLFAHTEHEHRYIFSFGVWFSYLHMSMCREAIYLASNVIL